MTGMDDLTIREAREIAALFGNSAPRSTSVDGDGRYVIVRARDAGVHFGKLERYDGRTVYLTESRRMWRWKAAKGISLSDCAMFGIDGSNSKICVTVPSIVILDACEIIDVDAAAACNIREQKVYTP
jgi:hypothetical protein